MSNSVVQGHYSLKTFKRVSDSYAKANPSKIETFAFDPAFLKKNDIVQDADGAALNLTAAREAKQLENLAQSKRDAKNAARRAAAAAKRAAVALAKPHATAKTVKNAVQKTRRRPVRHPIDVYYSTKTGVRVSETYGKNNPSKVEKFSFTPGQVPFVFLNRGSEVPHTIEKARSAVKQMMESVKQ